METDVIVNIADYTSIHSYLQFLDVCSNLDAPTNGTVMWGCGLRMNRRVWGGLIPVINGTWMCLIWSLIRRRIFKLVDLLGDIIGHVSLG